MRDPKQITRKRAVYIRKATASIKKVLNGYLADYMLSVKHASNMNDFVTAAEKPISKEPVESFIISVYRRVGADFAKLTIKTLQAKKSAPDPVELDFWEEYFVRFAKTKAAEKITWITNTTERLYKETVANIVNRAGTEGLSIFDTAKLIQNEIGYQNQYRAERIARTEIIAASNYGTLEGGRNAGIPVKKEWIPIVDQWSRPDHANMAGVVVAYDDDFNVGGVQMSCPGDERGGAEHVINCRCALAVVPDTSYDDIINR